MEFIKELGNGLENKLLQKYRSGDFPLLESMKDLGNGFKKETSTDREMKKQLDYGLHFCIWPESTKKGFQKESSIFCTIISGGF